MKAELLNRKGMGTYATSILISAACLLYSVCSGSPARSATQAQVLLQTDEMVGSHEVTYCPLGLKVKSMRGDYVFVMRPPDWKVTLYNPSKKIYFETTPTSWYGPNGGGVQSTWEDRYKELRVVSNSPGQYQAMKARHILWLSKIDPINSKLYDNRTLAKKNRLELLSKSADQWSTEDSPYLKQMALVLDRFYHVPMAPGLPLVFTYDGFSGTHHELLYTKRLEPKMVTAADFEPPKGMRQVAKERDVVFSENSYGLLDVLR
jgi:hypothetical protein